MSASTPENGHTGQLYDELLIKEHYEIHNLLMSAVDAMRVTQRLYDLSDGHLLISKCKEIEKWLDAHMQ